LGLALDESTENLDKIESNGINAFIDPNLLKFIENYGDINIDFVNPEGGQGGFMIKLSNAGDCGTGEGGCSSCG
jgi:Fe-S cluster assembly iron-binding protein IscA